MSTDLRNTTSCRAKIVNELGQTSLHVSAEKNNSTEIEILLSMGADVNARDKCHKTPLHLAAISNKGDSHYSTIESLLKNGADVNAQDLMFNRTPLHYLIDSSDLTRTLELFLKFGANVNLHDSSYRTPITNAITDGNEQTKKLLMNHTGTADINRKIGRQEYTLLHWACAYKRRAMVKFLVKNGADTNSGNYEGRTPLMIHLAEFSPTDNIVRFFFKHSNFNTLDLAGKNIINLRLLEDTTERNILRLLAKHQALDLFIHPSIIASISNHKNFNVDYFDKCKEELTLAKNTRLENCWITLFNLLVDCKRKLKNYAGNQDFVKSFNKLDLQKKFPIYGFEMLKNFEKGIERRELFDRSSVVLTEVLPVFNPNHLIIRDTLDILTLTDYGSLVSIQKLKKEAT